MNYINIIQLLEQFATKHKMVKRFKSDTLDKLSDFSNMSESFPLLYVVPVSTLPITNINQYRFIRYTFNIYCLVPKIQLKPTDDNVVLLNQSNINLNICSKILFDLYSILEDMNEFEVGDTTLNLVNNYGGDILQGFSGIFTIDVDNDDICNFPMESDLVINKFNCI